MNKFKEPGKTAITRKKLSRPMEFLYNNKMLKGRVLDYGCGKGFDANKLNIEMFDPNQEWNSIPSGKFDTIICNYVLNVISHEDGLNVVNDIKRRLNNGGTAFISVRRDIKKDTNTQRIVHLELPVEKEVNGSFCIYRVDK